MEEWKWKEYRLGDVCNIVGRIGFRGYTKDDFVQKPEDGAISLSPSNIVDGMIDTTKVAYISWDKYNESPEIMLHKGDVVLSKTGTIGRTAIVRDLPHPITLNPQLVVLKDIKINNYFLSYLLKSPYFQGLLYSITVGSVVSTLSQKNLSNLIIKVPCNEEQNRIVQILKSLDDKISNNMRINENLEQQAQALFKSWFVDFEPFKDQPFVESELGMIPQGWKVDLLGNLVDIKYGKDHKKLMDGNIPVYGSGGLMRKAEKALYSGESVLIPRKGTLNNVMYVNEAFWTVDTMFYSIPKVDNIMLFTFIYLSNRDLASLNAGSAVPSMTTEILNNMKIALPTHAIMEDFNKRAKALYSSIKHNEQESRRLAELRDTLLPRLMSGEINVNDVQMAISE